jgi:uncharacterized protein (UPF0147 family)
MDETKAMLQVIANDQHIPSAYRAAAQGALDRINNLEHMLREIKDIAQISKGGEFYTMLADKALNQNNDTAP